MTLLTTLHKAANPSPLGPSHPPLTAAPSFIRVSANSTAESGYGRSSCCTSVWAADAPLDERLCGVCLDAGDFVEMRPCGHKICIPCGFELISIHAIEPTPCP